MLTKHPGMFFATQSDFRNVFIARFFFSSSIFLISHCELPGARGMPHLMSGAQHTAVVMFMFDIVFVFRDWLVI